MSKSNLVHVGTFGSPIGLKGEIKVTMLTSSFEFFQMLKVYLNKDASEKWNFIKMRTLNKKLIVHPLDCNNRDDAEKFRGKKIFSQLSNFPKTNKGKYYARNLIGCSVIMINGDKIGNVVFFSIIPLALLNAFKKISLLIVNSILSFLKKFFFYF